MPPRCGRARKPRAVEKSGYSTPPSRARHAAHRYRPLSTITMHQHAPTPSAIARTPHATACSERVSPAPRARRDRAQPRPCTDRRTGLHSVACSKTNCLLLDDRRRAARPPASRPGCGARRRQLPPTLLAPRGSTSRKLGHNSSAISSSTGRHASRPCRGDGTTNSAKISTPKPASYDVRGDVSPAAWLGPPPALRGCTRRRPRHSWRPQGTQFKQHVRRWVGMEPNSRRRLRFRCQPSDSPGASRRVSLTSNTVKRDVPPKVSGCRSELSRLFHCRPE